MPELEKVKARLRFTKTGGARFVSHLDTMRVLQRAMSRAGVPAVHTGGFNPHPYLSIPNALSLGYGSICEIADIELPAGHSPAGIPDAMNAVLPDGIRIVDAYLGGRKGNDIAFADYAVRFVGITDEDAELIAPFFASGPVVVEKRSKHKTEDRDITELIRSIEVSGDTMTCSLVSALELSLNPSYLVDALRSRAGIKFEWADVTRAAFLDADGRAFR